MGTGLKYDSEKPRLSLLPWKALEAVAVVQMYGAIKYDIDNWKDLDHPIDRYTNAALRHLSAYVGGELNDPESSLPHLAHAGCNVLFALWFQLKAQPLTKPWIMGALDKARVLREKKPCS